MSKHNYSQYSKKNNDESVNAVITEPEVVAGSVFADQFSVQITPAVVEAPEVKMESEPAVQPENKPENKPEAVTGKVYHCAKLNVRAKASTTAEVVCVLNAETEVTIDVEKSTEDWLRVSTSTGVNGYCMRKFISASL